MNATKTMLVVEDLVAPSTVFADVVSLASCSGPGVHLVHAAATEREFGGSSEFDRTFSGAGI